MSCSSPSDLEKRLLLETTLFQEDTTPEALNALLDRLEVPSAPFSPEEEWARFRQAHPEHFRSRRPRRAPLWAAAACLIVAVVLPAAGSFFHASEPSAVTTSAISQPEEARAILYRLAGLSPAAGTPLRAELPFDGVLSYGPARLPLEAELYPLPFYSSDNPLSIEDGSIVNDPEIREAP